ncbi:MAG TPA: FtsX-like permease family protein [Streptosporangiaceae bacterium]|nr:FtsX-like permease family protein [Streptosporangiaceae bacterium]
MSGPAVRVAVYRLRVTLRRRWGGYLALALLVGLVGGVALASLTAARRTYASYPAFLASTNPSDLFVLPQTNDPEPGLVSKLARLPHVRSAEEGELINAATLTPDGKVGTVLETQVELVTSPDGLFSNQDKLRITQGRAANPARADEVVATNEAASVLHLHVGERIPVGISRNSGQDVRPYRRTDLTVVGIGVLGIQLVHDDIDSNRAGFLVGTPALLRQYESCCATNSYDGLQLDGGSRYAATVLQGYEHLIDNQALNYGQLVVYQTAAIEAEAQQAIRPEAIALAVFGVIALVAALIIGTQAISRQLHGNAGETEVLRALGADPVTTMADGLLGVVAAVVAGAVLAAAVAMGLSPLTLFGPVRTVETAPGIDADWTVLGTGMAVLAAVLALVAAGIAYRLAPQRAARRATAAGRGSRVVGAALAAGLPVSGGAGLRFAVEPGHGRTAVPVRSVMAGTVLAVLVGIATLTFGASLSTLISHPSLYGWNFDYALYSVDGYGPVPSRWTAPLLARDRDVAASTGAYFATVQIDGQTVPGIAVPTPAAITPRPLTGRKLAGRGQIVLGPATLAALHKRVGDTVTMSEGQIIPPTRLRIVGTAALPTIGDVIGVHASLSTGAIISTRSLPPKDVAAYGPFSGPNAVFIRLRPGVSKAAGMRSLSHIAAQLNRDSREPLVESMFGNVSQYVNFVSVLPVQRPAEIVNYKTMGAMPAVLAGGLAAGAVAGLGLTLVASVRRRRRDFATLKTLGFTRGQLAAAVAWQSTVVAAVGLVIGVPVGIAVGRWLWLAFARELSAVPDPVVPAASIALASVAALVVANLVAALPGRAAGRTPAAVVLRAE